jgi:cation diffusion facilitator family transporter
VREEPQPTPEVRSHDPRRRRAANASLICGIAIFVAKLAAWALTGSNAVLSDALESVVNVVASLFALFAIRIAEKPADRDHPFGHGKIELLSAAFEGGLVTFAALTIIYTAVHAILAPPPLRSLDVGLALTGAAALANLALGVYLLRVGRAVESPTLIADGHHVMSDVWTTLGAIVGLVIVRFTGITLVDPIVALLLGALLARTGMKLVVESANALMDREDPQLLERLVDAFRGADIDGVYGVHRLRAIRSGHAVYVEAHVYVPATWSISHGHEVIHALERIIRDKSGLDAQVALHLDPVEGAMTSTLATLTLEDAVRVPERLI